MAREARAGKKRGVRRTEGKRRVAGLRLACSMSCSDGIVRLTATSWRRPPRSAATKKALQKNLRSMDADALLLAPNSKAVIAWPTPR